MELKLILVFFIGNLIFSVYGSLTKESNLLINFDKSPSVRPGRSCSTHSDCQPYLNHLFCSAATRTCECVEAQFRELLDNQVLGSWPSQWEESKGKCTGPKGALCKLVEGEMVNIGGYIIPLDCQGSMECLLDHSGPLYEYGFGRCGGADECTCKRTQYY